MIHNIVVVDGREYKAVKRRGSCYGCAFNNVSEGVCSNVDAECMRGERSDKETARYKPHYKLKHK